MDVSVHLALLTLRALLQDWLPCMQATRQRVPWSFKLVVPNREHMMAVASGELQSKVSLPGSWPLASRDRLAA